MRTVFFWSAVFFLLFIPAVTMRLFAEERRTGSIELLVTLPVTESEVVLGKFLAALGLLAVGVVLTLPYPVTLSTVGDLDWGPVAGGYVGLLLLGASFAAIGTAASAFTSNQVVAFLIAVLVSLLPFATGFALQAVPAPILPLVQYLSFDYHFNNLARGVIDTRNLVFYASIILGRAAARRARSRAAEARMMDARRTLRANAVAPGGARRGDRGPRQLLGGAPLRARRSHGGLALLARHRDARPRASDREAAHRQGVLRSRSARRPTTTSSRACSTSSRSCVPTRAASSTSR